jgi:hypothetical protein
MTSGIARSPGKLVARLVAAGVVTVVMGCGGQAQGADTSKGGAGGSGSIGDANDEQTDGGGSGGFVWDASDASGSSDCKCNESGYIIKVNDGNQTLSLVHPFVSPEIAGHLWYCIPPAPALFTTHASVLHVDLTACAGANGGRPCLQLSTSAKASYLDEGDGKVWTLSEVNITAPGAELPKNAGNIIKGTFSTTAMSGTTTKSLTGTFAACYAHADWKPI